MVRLAGFAIFCLFVTISHAQIEFFGKAESVKSLNSPSGEQYIFMDYSGGKVFFSRVKFKDNTAGKQDPADIWMSKLDRKWSEPVNLFVNDSHFASPLGNRINGEFWLFNRVWLDKGTFYGGVFAINSDSTARKVDIPYFKNRSPIQTGCLSVDSRYMLLSLENNVSYGVDDIFVVPLQGDGTWGAPKNLGNVINTELQEITPFLAEDNRTLIFASNGHGGEGSFDLFKSERLDDTWQNWSKPENLGPAVNTSGSESSFSFKKSEQYAYYVSTQNSDGYGDIKRIKIAADSIKPVNIDSVVTLRIFEVEPVKMTFLLKDKRTDLPIEGTAVVVSGTDSLKHPSSPEGTVSLMMEGKQMLMEFKADGYLSVNKTITETMQLLEVIEVPLEPLETGNTITLENVLFYRTTANFIEGSETELNLVVEMMQENPEVKIFLKGHTDNVGNATLNLHLSKERVRSVKEYLIERGIDAARIDGEGYGGFKPIASNDFEETRKLNRRVEFEVIR